MGEIRNFKSGKDGPPSSAMPRRLAAIIAGDIAGYSRLMEQDEEGTHSRVKRIERDLIEPTIAEHHGNLVKTTGDGFIAIFDSPVEAVRCAIVIQQNLVGRNTSIPKDSRIEYRIGGWTRGQLVLMIIIGVASGFAYWFMDLRFWLALAIWAGLTEAIPFIGPFIGGGTAALVALADSPEKALWVVLFAVVLQQFEGAVLVPRVMKNAVGMSALTVVLAVLIGNALAGPLGSLLAIPIGAAKPDANSFSSFDSIER